MTYNNLIDLLRGIAEAHLQVGSFGNGNLSEVEGNTHLYPMVWATPVDTTTIGLATGSTMLVHRFRILCADLVHKDRSKEDEVLSDTERILLDIATVLKRSSDDFEVTGELRITPFVERFGDDVAGNMLEISVETSGDLNICAVPIAEFLLTQDGQYLLYETGGRFRIR